MAMMRHDGKGKPGMEKFDPSSILRDEIPYLPPEPRNAVLEAQQRTALETERIRRGMQEHIEKLERELQQIRNDFVEYKAEQKRKELKNKLEQAEIEKKNGRRSWLQVIIPLILSPLITLFIEHFEDVIGYLGSFFVH